MKSRERELVLLGLEGNKRAEAPKGTVTATLDLGSEVLQVKKELVGMASGEQVKALMVEQGLRSL